MPANRIRFRCRPAQNYSEILKTTTAAATSTFLNLPIEKSSHCSCPSALQQSNGRPHRITCCHSANHTVTTDDTLPRSHTQETHIRAQRHAPLPTHPVHHMPRLTKSIFFRILNRPSCAHSGLMPSSVSCVQCSVSFTTSVEMVILDMIISNNEFGAQQSRRRHASSLDATYPLAGKINFLARFKVEFFLSDGDAILRLC